MLSGKNYYPVDIPGSRGAAIQRWGALVHLGVGGNGLNHLVVEYTKEHLFPLLFGAAGPFKAQPHKYGGFLDFPVMGNSTQEVGFVEHGRAVSMLHGRRSEILVGADHHIRVFFIPPEQDRDDT